MTNSKYISKILFDNKLNKASYLNDLPIIKYLAKEKELSFNADVTFFVGENGNEVMRIHKAGGYITLEEVAAYMYAFGGWGEMFGNVTGGGEYSSKTNYSPTPYVKTAYKAFALQ